MKNSILSVLFMFLVLSCEKKSTETAITSSTPPDSITVPETNEPIESSTLQSCYMSNTDKDSVFLSLDDNLGTITGKLRYKNFEKDSSFGDIIGSKSGDTLKLNYTFQSEGMTSDREIYFIKKDGNLIEGIGDQKVTENKSTYTDYKKIKYEGGHLLKTTDCKGFENHFVVK